MQRELLLGVALTFAVSCADAGPGAGDGAGGSGASMEGLPCPGLAVDCRLAFSGDYVGTIAGASSGALDLYVNVIGGIEGTAGTATVTGQVNEFGRIEFSLPDGSTFTGQFAQDHSFTGTWTGPAGTGTFSGRVEGAAQPGGGGTGGGGAPAGGGAGASSDPQTLARARATCEAIAACPDAPSGEDCAMADPGPAACSVQANALYDCVDVEQCNATANCLPQFGNLLDCVAVEAGLSSPSDSVYEPSGNETYDEAIVVCSACEAEATTCYELPECLTYSECVEACPSENIVYCSDDCAREYPAGREAWFDAQYCDSGSCG